MTRKKPLANGSGVVPPQPMSLREFGHRLDSMLLDRGWTQADLSRHSKLSKDTISKWIAGKVDPSPYNLSKVASAFRISVDELYPHYRQSVERGRAGSGIEFNSDNLATGLLTIKRRVTMETAAKIKELLESDHADSAD